MKRRGVALIVLGGALAVWPALGYVREFVAVDTCLDAGGSFDYTHSRCDHVENHALYRIFRQASNVVVGRRRGWNCSRDRHGDVFFGPR